jgi:predicted house-cleaning noncanonical NTP pyrophosphatase (MazG superfamily)
MRYDKLVRDKIPEIIKENGDIPVTHIAKDEEYWQKLKQKLKEETDEFIQGGDIKELADVLELVYAICDFKGIGKDEMDVMRKRKSDERGAFKDRIILDETK